MIRLDVTRGVNLTDSCIDKFEVRNRQVQVFVDGGGYRWQELWMHDFEKDGRVLSWDEDMFLFTDTPGRPGPATWEPGKYPEGREDYRVTGVGRYEAEAHAEFADKSLQTVSLWKHVAPEVLDP